jgi:hypothetical protein
MRRVAIEDLLSSPSEPKHSRAFNDALLSRNVDRTLIVYPYRKVNAAHLRDGSSDIPAIS